MSDQYKRKGSNRKLKVVKSSDSLTLQLKEAGKRSK